MRNNIERYNSMTIEELEEEKRNFYIAMSNENIWCLGSHTVEEFNIHAQNVNDIHDEIEYVSNLIAERQAVNV
jgi:hypothetical protein